jgi:hypothetical protein
MAWIIGPSAGAYLFSHVGTYAPIYFSCALFFFNILIVTFCMPKEDPEDNDSDSEGETNSDKETSQQKQSAAAASGFQRILTNFHACFHSSNPCLTSVVSALLLFQWVMRTTSYKNIATYYETRYGTEPYQRGYLQSYQSALTFVVQSSLVRPILKWVGGEVYAACGAALLMAIVAFAELHVDYYCYLILLCPLTAIAMALLGICLKSVVSQVAPKESLGSVFATLDVLTNAAQVTVPFYRTMLFSWTQPDSNLSIIISDANNGNNGDPDPYRWLISSGIHWLIATLAFAYLLLHESPCAGVSEYDDEDDDEDDIRPLLLSSRKKLKKT